MIPEIFSFDFTKKELVVNNENLLAISCFKELIDSYDTSIVSLTQVFGYIYWHGSIYSPGILKGLTDKDLADNAKLNLNIPLEWNSTELIDTCIETYKISRNTAAIETLENLLISLNNINESIKIINAALKTILKGNITGNLENDLANVNKVLGYNKSITEIIKDLPNNIAKVKELQQSIIEGNENTTINARGKITVTSSMLGD